MKLTHQLNTVFVDLDNLVSGDTIVKRKAQVTGLVIDLAKEAVYLHAKVFLFAKEADDSYGAPIPIEPKVYRLIADRLTLVEEATGNIIGPSTLEQDDPNGLLAPYLVEGNDYCTEWEFFVKMGELEPVLVFPMMRNYVASRLTVLG